MRTALVEFCEAGAHRWLNRWRTMTCTCRLTWHGSSNTAADETIRRHRTDIRRLMPMLGEPSQPCRRTQERIPTTKQGDAGVGIAARHDNEELHPVSGRAWRVPAGSMQFHQYSATAFDAAAPSTRQRSRGSSRPVRQIVR